jgi:type IV secretion system protein VirB2
MKLPIRKWRRPCAVLVALLFAADAARAAGLPWEGPLQQIQASLTGPAARAIGVIALAVCGGTLAFGGELSDFTKRVMMVVMALSVMLLANNIIGIIG